MEGSHVIDSMRSYRLSIHGKDRTRYLRLPIESTVRRSHTDVRSYKAYEVTTGLSIHTPYGTLRAVHVPDWTGMWANFLPMYPKEDCGSSGLSPGEIPGIPLRVLPPIVPSIDVRSSQDDRQDPTGEVLGTEPNTPGPKRSNFVD